jgi:hypothetical protein
MTSTCVFPPGRYGHGSVAATNGGTGPTGLRNATVLDDWYGASYWNDRLGPGTPLGLYFNTPASHTQVWIGMH